jgi:DNA-binding MarR family transcriptional regulator
MPRGRLADGPPFIALAQWLRDDGEVPHTAGPTPQQVESVMAASRVLVAVAAESVAAVEEAVTLPQLRVLVMASTDQPLSGAAVAAALGVHASNATRTVDKLVAAGYLERAEDPDDRRLVRLTLTPSGRGLVAAVNDHRRDAISRVLDAMDAPAREQLATSMRTFASAAGEPTPDPVSAGHP